MLQSNRCRSLDASSDGIPPYANGQRSAQQHKVAAEACRSARRQLRTESERRMHMRMAPAHASIQRGQLESGRAAMCLPLCIRVAQARHACPALSCPVMRYHAVPCRAVRCRTMPCHAMPCHARDVQCHAMPLCSTVWCDAGRGAVTRTECSSGCSANLRAQANLHCHDLPTAAGQAKRTQAAACRAAARQARASALRTAALTAAQLRIYSGVGRPQGLAGCTEYAEYP